MALFPLNYFSKSPPRFFRIRTFMRLKRLATLLAIDQPGTLTLHPGLSAVTAVHTKLRMLLPPQCRLRRSDEDHPSSS